MHFLQEIKLIQGGMGVYVSNWRMARAVATARPGIAAGAVSGTALDVVYVRLLQLGDPGGHARRALHALDDQFSTDVGRKICDHYFIEGGKIPDARFRSAPMQVVRSAEGKTTLAPLTNSSADVTATPLTLDPAIIELLIATGFAEVWLAKEGHNGRIFINFLNKIELPLIYVMYGAMLAGVDGVIVGAGNPDGLPAICSQLAEHATVTRNLSVLYAGPGEQFTISFDPKTVADGAFTRTPLPRPPSWPSPRWKNWSRRWLRARARRQMASSSSITPQAATTPTRSAPCAGTKKGQPIYSTGRSRPGCHPRGRHPVLAGRRLRQPCPPARCAGSRCGGRPGGFGLCPGGGIGHESRVPFCDFQGAAQGADDAALVKTTMFSPTGFSFKVVQLKDTLSKKRSSSQAPCLRHRPAATARPEQSGGGWDAHALSALRRGANRQLRQATAAWSATPTSGAVCATGCSLRWGWPR
jgi:hypothetical protein